MPTFKNPASFEATGDGDESIDGLDSAASSHPPICSMRLPALVLLAVVGTMSEGDESSDSLLAALTEARITSDNFAFIRQVTKTIGIAGYRVIGYSATPVLVAGGEGLDSHWPSFPDPLHAGDVAHGQPGAERLSDRSYVEAKRRDGFPALHIYWGYTTGFTSKS